MPGALRVERAFRGVLPLQGEVARRAGGGPRTRQHQEAFRGVLPLKGEVARRAGGGPRTRPRQGAMARRLRARPHPAPNVHSLIHVKK